MKTGGIHEAVRICDAADQFGVKCMIGCMLESKVSVSAGVHLAPARSCVTMADLDGRLSAASILTRAAGL